MNTAEVIIRQALPTSAPAARVLRAYYADVVGRHHGRTATSAEVAAAMADEPSDDLLPPTGVLLLAHDDVGEFLGCAGLRLSPGPVGELTRVFVLPAARGRGLGARLVGELETHARGAGLRQLRLDTRSDLVEARRLYARLGYAEVEPFNDAPYAEHWLAKRLG